MFSSEEAPDNFYDPANNAKVEIISDTLLRRNGVLKKKEFLPVSDTNPTISKGKYRWVRVEKDEEEALMAELARKSG